MCIFTVLYYLLVSWVKNELGWEFPTAADGIAGRAVRSDKIDMSQFNQIICESVVKYSTRQTIAQIAHKISWAGSSQ